MKINYFNFKKLEDEYLLTNEQGNYYFLNSFDFKNLVRDNFDLLSKPIIEDLKKYLFVYDEDEDVFIEKASILYRDNKRYVFDATCLHIFVMTNACNMCCVYCQAQDSEQLYKGMMNKDTAKKAVEIALQAPGEAITFEFQGGEPLLNFEVIKFIVEYTEAHKNDKDVIYTIVTNTLLLTDEIIAFLKKYKVTVSTSLDGNREIHNANRPKIIGGGTYDIVCNNIRKLQNNMIQVGAIQTTTRKSLENPQAIVDTYREMDLHYLFIRPLTSLGYANKHWNEIGYTADEFLQFYQSALEAIIQYNKQGYKMSEGHAVIFLRKIIGHVSDNYMELRSPCGAGIGQMAYYYDGKIYTCDEGRMLAEMGLPDFQLGDVNQLSYDNLIESKVCKVTCQASVLEGIPQCCDCVYHPYCGVCPVINFAMEQNIYSRQANGFRCQIYKGILDILFKYLKTDKSVLEIFKTWL